MKKLFLLFAAICCTVMANAQSVGDWFVSGDLRYMVTSLSPNTVEVTTASTTTTRHYPLTAGTTSVTIPVKVKDNLGVEYTVTKIAGGTTPANGAFYKSGLQTINFAEGSQVAEIGDYAFYNSATTAITLPASVNSIGQRAFASCASLANVTVSWTDAAAIPTPGSGAFSGILSGAVLHIPFLTNALYKAKGWNQWFTIDAPTPANNQIFYRSANHQVITPNNGDRFGATITNNVYNTEADYGVITFSGEVKAIGGWEFQNFTNLTAIMWPSTVTSVGESAFSGCTNLSSIDLQEGLTIIDKLAFIGCASMSELIIPSTVIAINQDAFNGCQNLTKLTVKAGSIGNYAFSGCTKLSSVDLQEGVTSIGNYAFSGCAGTSELIIPSTVESIGMLILDGWEAQTNLTIKAANIGRLAFNGCTNLSSIDLQEGVTGIEAQAFEGCANIKELTIPSTVKTIGIAAFKGCENLAKLTIKGGSVGEEAFKGCAKLVKLTMQAGSIGERAFFGCMNLSSIDLQEGVTSIEARAFDGCPGTTELTIPSTVTVIAELAFNGWNDLTNLTIKGGTIVGAAFAGCTSLTKLTMHAGTIGNGAFCGLTNLSSIDLQEGVKSIGANAFEGCTSIAEITISSTISTIGANAFEGCTSIAEITIPSTISTIGANAFKNCTGLTSVTFLAYCMLSDVVFYGVGTESPVTLKIPSAWLVNDKPVNSTTPWHGGHFNCTYEKTAAEVLGSLGEKQDGPAIEVIDQDDNVLKLYNPKQVNFIKVKVEE